MLQADLAMYSPAGTAPSAAMSVRSEQKRRTKPANRPFRLTWSSVEFDGSSIGAEMYDLAVRSIAEAMKAALSNDKDELLITNMAPGAEVGSAAVADFQDHVEALVEEAAARIGHDAPEMRLSLRGDQYDLRCYMGRTKPTDYVFDAGAA